MYYHNSFKLRVTFTEQLKFIKTVLQNNTSQIDSLRRAHFQKVAQTQVQRFFNLVQLKIYYSPPFSNVRDKILLTPKGLSGSSVYM